jgi:2-polyprenyl-3-methyl-5-hydroxy-6-metoxy-1,4-benzoquinol methylase
VDRVRISRRVYDPTMSALEQSEPRFFDYWRAFNRDDDPQLERWIEYEGNQLTLARERLAEISRYVELNGRTVLDVGCQWGATSIAAAELGAIPTGMDIDEDLMVGARIRAEEQGAGAKFRCGHAEDMPFPDACFDATLCVNVLEHVRDHAETVSELVRVTRPGGLIYLDGPNRWSPEWLKSDPHYQMKGISILPPRMGAFYVTRMRRYPSYDVGTFPVASRIGRMLERAGATIVASSRTGPPSHRRLARLSRRLSFNADTMFFFAAQRR